jgi:FMN-dependent NADH-azoreductase
MGLADVAFIHAEKIGFGPDAREAALIGASEKISMFCSQGLRKAA